MLIKGLISVSHGVWFFGCKVLVAECESFAFYDENFEVVECKLALLCGLFHASFESLSAKVQISSVLSLNYLVQDLGGQIEFFKFWNAGLESMAFQPPTPFLLNVMYLTL